MTSSHLYFFLPLGLAVKGFHLNIFLAALASGILCIWPNRLSLWGFDVADCIFVLYQFVNRCEVQHILRARRCEWGEHSRSVFITDYISNNQNFSEFKSRMTMAATPVPTVLLSEFENYDFPKNKTAPIRKGHAVVQLVEALRYKPESRGFDSRWCNPNFSLT